MITKATYVKDYIIHFFFDDGFEIIIDFEPRIRKHAIYKRFLKPENFVKFKVEHGTRLSWPGNVLDFNNWQLRNYYKQSKNTLLQKAS